MMTLTSSLASILGFESVQNKSEEFDWRKHATHISEQPTHTFTHRILGIPYLNTCIHYAVSLTPHPACIIVRKNSTQ